MKVNNKSFIKCNVFNNSTALYISSASDQSCLILILDIINTIRKFLHEDKLPHLLFYGPPGTGKTSTILACAKEIYKPKEFNSMVLELNASDDRGNQMHAAIFTSAVAIISHGTSFGFI